MKGDFRMMISTNLPEPLFFKEGNPIEKREGPE
jgi:hypothetical protein